MKQRHDNRGLRKVCGHPRRGWAKCECPWHFNFKWNGEHYRFSLERCVTRLVRDERGKWQRDRTTLGDRITSKTDATKEADRLRTMIRSGELHSGRSQLDAMTLRQTSDVYLERFVEVDHPETADEFRYSLDTICRTVVPRPAGGSAPLGDWRMDDIVTDTIKRFREIRLKQASGKLGVGVNRNVLRLRALFRWAITSGYTERTPFKLNGEATITPSKDLSLEMPRSRRLHADEAGPLLAAAKPHLQSAIIAAIESGMRKGEILSLQWSQVEGMEIDDEKAMTWKAKADIFLPKEKTKTRKDRRVPISTGLKAILEMRRLDPTGEPHALDAYVFGSESGTRVTGFKRAWNTAVLKSHGHTPVYSDTANLDADSRKALATIDLHFHDLRREAGSRWLEGGVPLHKVRDWLGHTNIAQTSTYLASTSAGDHDDMRRFEERQAALQRLATKAGKGGHKRTSSAKGRDRRTNETAVGHNPSLM
jgi:integrase